MPCNAPECVHHRQRHALANRQLTALGWFSCDDPACACGRWHESPGSPAQDAARLIAALRACLLAHAPALGLLTDAEILEHYPPQ